MAKTARTRTAPLWVVMTLYLLGIFMGAIDTGIITPARTIIQNDLKVDEQLGIWMITIYTLAYAASIPIMGKLADRLGRKRVYLLSIALFGAGSLACGLAQDFSSFEMLIAARAVQAIGGGGILPIATAEFGSVPEERRGMALGLVGGVYGIANVFGASAGSLILDIAGSHNWQWIFYVNLPIAALIIVAGVVFLPDHREETVKRIDIIGSLVLVAMILSLLYGLRNIDFFNLGASLHDPEVYPFLLGFLALLPVLIVVEKRAEDPVLNLRYFTNRGIGMTLLISMVTGFILMGVIFVPQLAENALLVPTGKGGYFVIILGLFSGVGAPLSGKLTDKYGPKLVLGLGMAISAIAAAEVVWWLIPHPGWPSVITALVLMGLGLGFTVGSPLNYMMLQRTPAKESNSALATLSLVRSIGTTLAPAIMIGFLVGSATSMQSAVLGAMPQQITTPELPYAKELQTKLDKMRTDEATKEQFKDLDIPDFETQRTVTITMDGDGELPPDLVERLKSADVTTITDDAKEVAKRMFGDQKPGLVKDATGGVQKGIDQMNTGVTDMSKGINDMDTAIKAMDAGVKKMDAQISQLVQGRAKLSLGISGITQGINGMEKGQAGLTNAIAGMKKGEAGLVKAIAGMKQGEAGLVSAINGMDAAIAGQKEGVARLEQVKALFNQLGITEVPDGKTLLDLLPPTVVEKMPESVKTQVAAIRSVAEVNAQIATLNKSIAETQTKREAAQAELTTLRGKLATAEKELATLRTELTTAETKLVDLNQQLAKARADKAKLSAQLKEARSQLAELNQKLATAKADRHTMMTARGQMDLALSGIREGRAKLVKSRAELAAGRSDLLKARTDLQDTIRKMGVLKKAIPGAFDQALSDYLDEVEKDRPALELAFQSTLNEGFKSLYLFYGAVCLFGLVLLLAVPKPPRLDDTEPETVAVSSD